ncbi:MAG: hypothetical protein WC684_08530 [Hyphomicrobium sp.]|jgi:hypothetical protein
MKYEERYVALIDILGFSARILADQSGSGAAELAQIYKEIRGALKPYGGAKRADWISLTLFSDTVVASTLARDDETDINTISEFLWCVRRISLILLSHGFLSRGCALKGRVVHSGDFIVGPAIITAHEYESKVARHPRILVIRDLRKKMERSKHLKQFLSECSDGPRHLHVLYDVEKFFRGVPQIGEAHARQQLSFSYVVAARKTLDDALEETADFPELFEKVKWFANYFNDTIFTAYESPSKDWPQPIEIGGYY